MAYRLFEWRKLHRGNDLCAKRRRSPLFAVFLLASVTLAFAVAPLWFATGCATPSGPPKGAVPTERQLAAFLRGQKDPREYWITMVDHEYGLGPVFENSNRVHEGYGAQLAFESAGKAPYPLVRQPLMKGDEALVLFDTSSKESWIDYLAADSLQMEPLRIAHLKTRPSHIRENETYITGVAHSFKIDGIRMESAVFGIRPQYGTLGATARGLRDTAGEPTIVVGNQMMRSLAFIHFDFPARAMVAATSTEYLVHPDTKAVSIPLKRHQGGIAVRGSINGGPEEWIMIDTGGDFEIALTAAGASASQPVDLRLDGIEWNKLIPVKHATQGLTHPDVPRLGLHAFKEQRMTIDWLNNQLIFEDSITPPPEVRREGLFFRKRSTGSPTE